MTKRYTLEIYNRETQHTEIHNSNVLKQIGRLITKYFFVWSYDVSKRKMSWIPTTRLLNATYTITDNKTGKDITEKFKEMSFRGEI